MFAQFQGDGRLEIGTDLIDRETGLGSLLKSAFSRMGIPPCGGCGRRAEWLDRHIVITPERERQDLFED